MHVCELMVFKYLICLLIMIKINRNFLVPTSSSVRMLEKSCQNIQHIDGFLTVIRQLSVLVYRVNKVA
jgi:hypothetical protein